MRWPVRMHWVIVLALTLGQYVALAHEYSGESHDLGAVCQLCLHHHQSKELLHSTPFSLAPLGADVAIATATFIRFDATTTPYYQSRAPPLPV